MVRLSAAGSRQSEPVADRAAHDQLEAPPREPGHLLGEHGHALPPRAWHAGDVGAPEHPLRPEGVVDATQVVMDVPIGIGRARVAGRPGGLDRDVGVLGQRQHLGQVGPRRVVLGAGGPAQVVDDQLEPRMALRDLAHRGQVGRREERDRQARALRRGPEPVHRPVGRPRALVRLQQREAQPEHPRPLLPAVDQAPARGGVEREIAEDRQAIRMAARRLHRQLVGVRVPRGGRVDDRAVDARLVHLGQQIVGGVGLDLPVVRVGGLVVGPDVDLRVDDQHGRPRGSDGQMMPRLARSAMSAVL